MKSGFCGAVLQFVPLTDEPTTRASEVPPDPKPSASDIVSKNVFDCATDSRVEKEPFPVLESKAESGIEMF